MFRMNRVYRWQRHVYDATRRWYLLGRDRMIAELKPAAGAISRAGLHGRITVAHGDAAAANPQLSFALARFDHVMISYALAMIPDWRQVLETAATKLCPGGRLHVVDFANFDRLPGIAFVQLSRRLSLFEVSPRDPERKHTAIAASSAADLTFDRPFRGYAHYAVLTPGAGPGKP
jgi:S-adenosylmethionine-diacylgycerolhomoserine-N-methlytransferase